MTRADYSVVLRKSGALPRGTESSMMHRILLSVALVAVAAAVIGRPDEGMWT
jgi:hypothetical protein